MEHRHSGVNIGGVSGERIFHRLEHGAMGGFTDDPICFDNRGVSDRRVGGFPEYRSADDGTLSMLPEDRSSSTRTL